MLSQFFGGQGFKANTVPASDGGLPEGTYTVMITSGQIKPTKNNNGHYLEITFTVVEGTHQNRKMWARLNLDNPNKMAVDIARQELASIVKACGKGDEEVNEVTELANIPLQIIVKETKDKTGTEIKKYLALTSSPSTVAKQQPTAAGQRSDVNPFTKR